MTPPGGRHFHEELAKLKGRLLEMSALAEELVRQAVDAFEQHDVEKARHVIEADNRLDALEIAIDDLCIHLLALHQPMARDLRFLTMAMKIGNDLERVGDHAVNIAQAVERLVGQAPLPTPPEIEEMEREVIEMLGDVIDAFVRGDAEAARAVIRRDDRVDALRHSLDRVLLTHMMEDPRKIGPGLSLLLVARNLERIGDLATNIAEDVVYLVEGKIIKHPAAQEQVN